MNYKVTKEWCLYQRMTNRTQKNIEELIQLLAGDETNAKILNF